MKSRPLIIIGIITAIAISITVFGYDQYFQLTNSDETNLSALLNGNSLCFDSSDEEPTEICYSLDELETYGCSMSLLEYLAQYSNLLDADYSEMFYIEWPSLSNDISEKDYDVCIEFLNSVRLPVRQENESLQVTDSLTIPNAERDAKLAAGYKLCSGVGWISPDKQKNAPTPIYVDNPNNPGELILDIDAMIKEYDALNSKGCPQFCSKKVTNNVFSFCGGDGFYSEGYMFTNNSTHYFDHNECEWIQNEKPTPLDIESIEDGRIKLYPVDTCAGIDINRLTLDELNQRYPATFTTKSGKTYEIEFLNINDDDLKEMPVISELIRATHQIPFPLNGEISASKGLIEDPDWNDYREWYDQKKTEQFNLDEVRVRGFVYNEEYYSIGFSIC